MGVLNGKSEAIAEALTMPAPGGRETAFVGFHALDDYSLGVDKFSARECGQIPVFIDRRPDLQDSIRLAQSLYTGSREPAAATYGVLIGLDEASAVVRLCRPLAKQWLSSIEALPQVQGGHTVIVVGLYEKLTEDRLGDCLTQNAHDQNAVFGFLSGRDLQSLSWLIAKQWASPSLSIQKRAVFSQIAAPSLGNEKTEVFGEAALDRSDIGNIITGVPWKSVMFQGHGKEDSINLGDHTICGKNEFAMASVTMQGPRCAYGHGCYKDESKLVSLRAVPALEVVLSACNSGPFSDLSLYHENFVLLLNALDGPAQDVIASHTVHDSSVPENRLYVNGALHGSALAQQLNQSLRFTQPLPSFWHFGLPLKQAEANVESTDADPRRCLLTPSLQKVHEAAVFWRSSFLLPNKHWLRGRVEHWLCKLDLMFTRDMREGSMDRRGFSEGDLERDAAAIDHAMALDILKKPEGELLDFASYLSDRGSFSPGSQRKVLCACGRMAASFVKISECPGYPSLESVVCFRCGDRCFRVSDGPTLWVTAADQSFVGGELDIEINAQANGPLPVRIGAFTPAYLRPFVTSSSGVAALKPNRAGKYSHKIKFRFSEETRPQAYYFTCFAVQGLRLCTLRQHFGLLP